ncbi:T9SS type A sorting domain-containing protein [Aureispira sp. CCB-QB1]|uniref:T9SS type A sorting domain-containing protein n=1 Tax=Aureispira sp. CCB-QB1 TaxID=1313421 RepID=UPI0006985D0D|nr:T9SS type A sorting domain-containing protein [Aureispira sp. CCB-QB1]
MTLGCGNTILTSLEVTDSCYYVTGGARDSADNCNFSAVFAKYDTLGNLLFYKILLDSLFSNETWAPSLQTNHDGNLVLSAYRFDTIQDMMGGVLKYESMGNLIWSSFYYNPNASGYSIRPDDMAMSSDSSYVIVSSIDNTQGGASDIGIIKVDQSGNEELNITRGTLNYVEHNPRVHATNDNHYIIGYQQDNLSGVQMNYTVRSKLEKIDSLGNTIWTYQSPNNQQIHGVNDLILSKDGGLVVASAWGSERLNPTGTYAVPIQEAYVYKLDSAQNFLWGTKFHSDALTTANFQKIIELEDSSLVAIGTVVRLYPPSNPTYNIVHGRIVKLSPQGDSIWSRDYEYLSTANARHTVYDAERTPDGGFLVCGEANGVDTIPSNPIIFQQGWLIKLDEQGCLVPGCHTTTGVLPLEQEGAISLLLYPNPTTDYLNVHYYNKTTKEELTFCVVDLQGRVLHRYTTYDQSDKTYIVPVSGLVAGVYVLEVRQEGELIGREQFVKR